MTKSELVEQMAKDAGLSKAAANRRNKWGQANNA